MMEENLSVILHPLVGGLNQLLSNSQVLLANAVLELTLTGTHKCIYGVILQ